MSFCFILAAGIYLLGDQTNRAFILLLAQQSHFKPNPEGTPNTLVARLDLTLCNLPFSNTYIRSKGGPPSRVALAHLADLAKPAKDTFDWHLAPTLVSYGERGHSSGADVDAKA